MTEIKVRTGQVLEEIKSGIIIQQVNAQGAMGSGFAKAIMDKYPKVKECYSRFIKPKQPDQGLSYMGELILTRVLYEPDLWIANIVGQQFYGQPGFQVIKHTDYDALRVGFGKLKAANGFMFAEPLPIHFPMLGSGLGGGHWPTVKAAIQEELGEFDLTLWLRPGEAEAQ